MRLSAIITGFAIVAAAVIFWTQFRESGGGEGEGAAAPSGNDVEPGGLASADEAGGSRLADELEEPARENATLAAPADGGNEQPAEEQAPRVPLTGREADEAVLEELSSWGTDELIAEHKKQHQFLVEVASPVYESFFDAGDYESLVGEQAKKAANAELNTTPYSVRLFNDGTAQRVILRESEFPELFEAKRRMSIAEDVLRSRGVRTSF